MDGGRGGGGGYVKFNMSFTNSQDVKMSAEGKRGAAEGRRRKGSPDAHAAAANRCVERAQETGMKRPIYDKTRRRWRQLFQEAGRYVSMPRLLPASGQSCRIGSGRLLLLWFHFVRSFVRSSCRRRMDEPTWKYLMNRSEVLPALQLRYWNTKQTRSALAAMNPRLCTGWAKRKMSTI